MKYTNYLKKQNFMITKIIDLLWIKFDLQDLSIYTNVFEDTLKITFSENNFSESNEKLIFYYYIKEKEYSLNYNIDFWNHNKKGCVKNKNFTKLLKEYLSIL